MLKKIKLISWKKEMNPGFVSFFQLMLFKITNISVMKMVFVSFFDVTDASTYRDDICIKMSFLEILGLIPFFQLVIQLQDVLQDQTTVKTFSFPIKVGLALCNENLLLNCVQLSLNLQRLH